MSLQAIFGATEYFFVLLVGAGEIAEDILFASHAELHA